MDHFQSFGLSQPLLQSVNRLNFKTPTPIQARAIPAALNGRDILGSAQTGTGKTLAFGLPILERLMSSPRGSALVITPTRELAAQVVAALDSLIPASSGLRTALLIGGESMNKQLQQLKRRPRLFVGTPGRINDHLERGSLRLHDTGFLVLDETDRMLDMGFSIQINRILKFLPVRRQTLLFSATVPQSIVKMAASYLTDPERIAIGSSTNVAEKVKQETLHLSEDERYGKLVEQLNQREGSILVFMKTKHGAEKMARRLKREELSTAAIHGNLRQNRRDAVIKRFRDGKTRILVATDIAARGLDIPHIEHVINYQLPQCPQDYIHRIGRTARAGADGEALCFVTPSEEGKWKAITRFLETGDLHGSHGKGSEKKKPSNSKNRRRTKNRRNRARKKAA